MDALPHEIVERRIDGSVSLEARAAAEPVGDDEAGEMPAARRPRVSDVLRAVVADLQVRRREPLTQPRLDLSGGRAQSSSVSG